MLFTSTIQTAFGLQTPDGNQNNKPEYEISYRSIAEDENGFTAQFIVKNNTDQAITDWTFNFDYNMRIEESKDLKLSKIENGSDKQYRFHYQLEGIGEIKTIAPKSEIVLTYQVKQKLNINDTPQNYNFKYKLQPENPFLPADTEAYARQEWISDLMEAVNFSYVSTDITSSYIDVAIDSPYLNSIEMALNNKVITKDEIGKITQNGIEVSGAVFHPASSITREFAILTALKALRYEKITTANDRFNLAVRIGLMDESSNGTTFTTQEAKAMLEIIKEKAKIPEYEEGIEGTVDIKESVIQISKEDLGNSDYQFDNDEVAKGDNKGRLSVPNVDKTRQLKAGDVFILPSNGANSTDITQKVEKIIEIQKDKIVLTTIAPELDEFLGDEGIIIKGSHQSAYNEFIPSENFDVIYDGVTNPNNVTNRNSKIDSINKFGNMTVQGNKIIINFNKDKAINGKIELNYPKIGLDVDIDPGFLGLGSQINKFNLSLENSFNADLKLSGKSEKEVYLGEVGIPINVYGMSCKLALYVNVSVDGEVSLTYKYSSVNGFDYSSSDGFQSYAQNTSELDFNPFKVKAKAGFNPALVLQYMKVWDLADFGIEAGVAGEASETVRSDGICLDASAYVYLSLEALTSHSILGEYIDAGLTKDIWDSGSSPVRFGAHYEHNSVHAGKVPECSYGTGSLKLQVNDYDTGNTLNAHLKAKKNGGSASESIDMETNNGSFSLSDISTGSYSYTIESNGYITYAGKFKIRNGSENDLGVIKLVKSGNGKMSGSIRDALTGSGVNSVKLTLLEGHDIDETSEESTNTVEFSGSSESNSNGQYNFNAPNGYYTLKMEKEGYTSAYTNITIITKGSSSNVTLVPDGSNASGADIGDLRIVLTWGSSPSDLDSHLCGPTSNGIRRFHTYYSNRSYFEGRNMHAFLDRDDTTSYGPETSTVYDINSSGKYSFYVHDYSNRGSKTSSSLSLSEARVNIYVKEETGDVDSNGEKLYRSKLLATYKVPTNEEGTL